MKKRITLLLLGLMTIAPVFSQTIMKGESRLKGGTSTMGPNWETFTVVETTTAGGTTTKTTKTYDYFLGNDSVDNLTVGKLLGFHWKGRNFEDVLGDTVYFVNVKTGEYLQIGDFWGENSITSHVGLPYRIISGTSTRKLGTLTSSLLEEDMSKETYWLQPLDVREERVIGRQAITDGVRGSFEQTGYLYLRTQKEYNSDDKGNGPHTGALLFKFSPYTTANGEQAYVIYTRRKTYNGAAASDRMSEYNDRDSYYLLTSIAGTDVADFNNVRAKKFAGQTRYRGISMQNPGISLTFNRTSNTAATVTVTDLFGQAISGVSATLVSTSFSEFKTGTSAALTGGKVLAPNTYSNGQNGEITYTFQVSGLSSNYFNRAAIDVYSMTGDGKVQNRTTERSFEFSVKTGTSSSSLSTFGSLSVDNINSDSITTESYGGLNHGWQEMSGSVTASSTFYIQVTLKKTASEGNYAGIGAVRLYDNRSTVTSTLAFSDDRDDPYGDEVEIRQTFNNADYVSAEDGLNEAKNHPENLWKIVTKRQRDGYRIVASEEHPVDVSGRIENPTYNTSWVYNQLVSQCKIEDGRYVSDEGNKHPDYGWDWFERDQQTHPIKHHVHPWNLAETADNYSIEKEFHKVGTGRFWRYSERNAANDGWIGGRDDNMQEAYTTFGTDANYCGSIYKGTANLQQTITGLKPGNYIVYVRAFFAPHNMEKYQRTGTGSEATLNFNGETMGSVSSGNTWYDEAITRTTTDTVFWRRSHDSYLFAWSKPDGETDKEVRRMLPSVYEGSTPIANLSTMSKNAFVDTGGGHEYTGLNGTSEAVKDLVRDNHVFAFFSADFFGLTGNSNTYAVPRMVSGAGRFFEAFQHPTANNYRIGLPVVVGDDGTLVIGVDHTNAADGSYEYENPTTKEKSAVKSGENEWVCFDEWELLYLGANEPEEFIVDELNGQYDVKPRKFVNGHTGEPWKAEDDDGSGGNYETYASDFTDYMNQDKSAKLSSEILENRKIQNNTQFLDLFSSENDIDVVTHGAKGSKVVKNVIIRRTMMKDNWNYIVLPLPLTRAQVEEGFGESVLVSKLSTVKGRTLVYEAVESSDKNAAYLEAGVPYIIYPTRNPHFSENEVYPRWKFSKKVSNTLAGVAGYFFQGNHYLRNYEVEDSLKGPLYVIQNVEIFANEVFPNWDKKELSAFSNITDWKTNRQTGTVQWKETGGCSSDVSIRGLNGTYTLKEYASYENPENVPANSYYLNKGAWRYTSEGFSTTKGLMAYIQLLDKQNDNKALAKSFLDGSFYFEPVENWETDGIENVDNSEPEAGYDHSLKIYDLMGRKVTNPRPGTIYIMNGMKVMWK